MKDEKIHAVSEAFSMQPKYWYVGGVYKTGATLTKIVQESVYDTGDPFDCYVGYDNFGSKVFQIRVQCATVEFN